MPLRSVRASSSMPPENIVQQRTAAVLFRTLMRIPNVPFDLQGRGRRRAGASEIVQSKTARHGCLCYRLAVPKPSHAAKLAYIRRMCLSAESIHNETARLVADLSDEIFYVSSTSELKPATADNLTPRRKSRRKPPAAR
jgi:hypothetical protein